MSEQQQRPQPTQSPDAHALGLAIELGGEGAEARLEEVAGQKAVVLTMRGKADSYPICRQWAEMQARLGLPPLQIAWKRDKGAPAAGTEWHQAK